MGSLSGNRQRTGTAGIQPMFYCHVSSSTVAVRRYCRICRSRCIAGGRCAPHHSIVPDRMICSCQCSKHPAVWLFTSISLAEEEGFADGMAVDLGIPRRDTKNILCLLSRRTLPFVRESSSHSKMATPLSIPKNRICCIVFSFLSFILEHQTYLVWLFL